MSLLDHKFVEEGKEPEISFWEELRPIYNTKWAQLSNGEKLGYRTIGGDQKSVQGGMLGEMKPKATLSTPGEIDTILIIHGQFQCSLNMELYMKELEKDKNYFIVAPCLRGFGYSSYKTPINSLKELAEDLVLFVKEELKLNKKFYVMGHNIGTIIAIYLANLLPDLVKGIILMSCVQPENGWRLFGMSQCKTKEDVANSLKLKEIKDLITGKQIENFQKNFSKDLQLPQSLPDSVAWFYICILSRQRHLLETLFFAMTVNLVDEIKQLKCKVKIIHGLLDSVMPCENSIDYKEILQKQASVSAVNNGTHHLFIQKPDVCFKNVQKFIRNTNNAELDPDQQFFEEETESEKEKIHIYISTKEDIHFNLATEEYLFEHYELEGPTLFLWRNSNCIVLGKHQNPWKECWIEKMKEDNIKLARRRSGGGAVYQDFGNSCFTFINPIKQGDLALDSVKKINNKILLAALKNLGITAEVSGRNDLMCQGAKISGSAYKVNLGKKKTLHHGTMLLHLDMKALANYLNPSKPKLKSKGVDSVVKRVMNLNEINSDLKHGILCREIEKEFTKHYKDSFVQREVLNYKTLEKIKIINNLYTELKSDDWLYSKTPEFTNQFETRFDWGTVDFFVEVKEGIIKDGKCYSDCLYPEFIDVINKILNRSKISYSGDGKKMLCKMLRSSFPKEPQSKYIDDLEGWLVKMD